LAPARLRAAFFETVNASNSRLPAGEARLRLFGGKDLKTNPCGHFKCEMPQPF
jgi:hypothetical protein